MELDFGRAANQKPPQVTAEERRLIDEAVAAGKVRRVPAGIGANHPNAHKYLRPLASKLARVFAAWSRQEDHAPVDAVKLMNYLRRSERYSRHVYGKTVDQMRQSIDIMVAHGYATVEEAEKGGWRTRHRYRITDKCPPVDPATLKVKRRPSRPKGADLDAGTQPGR